MSKFLAFEDKIDFYLFLNDRTSSMWTFVHNLDWYSFVDACWPVPPRIGEHMLWNEYYFLFLISLFVFLTIIFILSLLFEENLNKIKVLHKLSVYHLFFILLGSFSLFSTIESLPSNKWYYMSHLDGWYVWYWGLNLDMNASNLYPFFLIMFFIFLLFILFYSFSTNFLFKQSKDFEFSLLLALFLLMGSLLILGARFIEIFLCLECIGLISYILMSMERSNKWVAKSGIRYLILSSVPSALFALGFIYFYEIFGTTLLINIEQMTSLVHEFSIKNWYYLLKLATNHFRYVAVGEVIQFDLFLDHNRWGSWRKLITIDTKVEDYPQLKALFDKAIEDADVAFVSIYGFDEWAKRFKAAIVFDNFSDILLLTSSYLMTDTFNINYDVFDKSFSGIIIAALVFILISFFFKIAAAPFHVWAPSIYNAGPLASVTFLNTFSKAVILSFILYFFTSFLFYLKLDWSSILNFIGLVSVFVGTFGTLNERHIKKFFVYSSIVDIGLILLGISCSLNDNSRNVFFYIFLYTLTSLVYWLMLLYSRDFVKYITNFSLILTNEFLMKFIIGLLLFSSSGIPPFGGFIIKLDILTSLMEASFFWLVFFVLFLSIISLFYYLRLIKISFFDSFLYGNDVIINKIQQNILLTIVFIVMFVCGYGLIIDTSIYYIHNKIMPSQIL